MYPRNCQHPWPGECQGLVGLGVGWMHKGAWLGALYSADTKVWAGLQVWEARDRVESA